VAEATGTELALAQSPVDDGDGDIGSEQKSGFMQALSNVDMLRQIILVIALVICVAIAFFYSCLGARAGIPTTRQITHRRIN
jgi:flagellar M-ring protein FliF